MSKEVCPDWRTEEGQYEEEVRIESSRGREKGKGAQLCGGELQLAAPWVGLK